MKRILTWCLFAALVLAGCGGSGDVSVPEPPRSTPYESSGITEVDQIIEQWQASVPQTMDEQEVKPETIEQATYQSTASLQEIATFYDQLTESGWMKVDQMPNLLEDQGLLLAGYENGTTTLIVGAIDLERFGGDGVVIYTAKGTR